MSNNPFKSASPRDTSVSFDNRNDIAPPPGPPPPKFPKGWLAKWDDRYNAWYYVNLATKKFQWEPPRLEAEETSRSPTPGGEKPPPYEAAANGSRESPAVPPTFLVSDNTGHLMPPSSASPPRSRSHSLGSKISKFVKSHSPQPGSRPHYTPPPSQYFGVAHPQPMYHAPQPNYGGGYGAPAFGGQSRRPGLGPGAAMGLGVGGGLLGGMMLQDAINDHEQDIYQDGFQEGAQYDQGDYGGGDFGGGDFGGDFGDF